MEEIKDRLKLLRNRYGLNQTEFAHKLGIPQKTYSSYETGTRPIPERFIVSLSAIYNVSETWLRTGEGAIDKELTPDEHIAFFIGQTLSGDSDFKRRFIYALSRLDDAGWDVLRQFADDLSSTETKKEDRE